MDMAGQFRSENSVGRRTRSKALFPRICVTPCVLLHDSASISASLRPAVDTRDGQHIISSVNPTPYGKEHLIHEIARRDQSFCGQVSHQLHRHSINGYFLSLLVMRYLTFIFRFLFLVTDHLWAPLLYLRRWPDLLHQPFSMSTIHSPLSLSGATVIVWDS